LPADEKAQQNLTLANRIETHVDELAINRKKAQQVITTSQQKQKDRYDSHLRKEFQFAIGDRVLYYNAAQEKTWTGKLEQKWKGPFTIRKIIGNGAYKLIDEKGKKVKTTVNGCYLKLYKTRVHWDPIIYIS